VSLPLAYVPAIHVFANLNGKKTWMPGTRPGMTALVGHRLVTRHCHGKRRQIKPETGSAKQMIA
jgi:hypothetical protein